MFFGRRFRTGQIEPETPAASTLIEAIRDREDFLKGGDFLRIEATPLLVAVEQDHGQTAQNVGAAAERLQQIRGFLRQRPPQLAGLLDAYDRR
jgi:hypothetical protein